MKNLIDDVRKDMEESTEVYNKHGITITRFSMGKGKVGIQLEIDKKIGGGGYVAVDGNYVGRLIDALQATLKRGMK